MGDLLNPLDLFDIIDVLQTWRQTGMYTEHSIVNNCGQRQVVEQVCELLPDRQTAVLALALDLKSIDLRDLARFVISSQQSETTRISQF
jgi:hypothetical protein